MDLVFSKAARYIGCAINTVRDNLKRGKLQPGTEQVSGGAQRVSGESVVRLRRDWEAEGRTLPPIPQDIEEELRHAGDL